MDKKPYTLTGEHWENGALKRPGETVMLTPKQAYSLRDRVKDAPEAPPAPIVVTSTPAPEPTAEEIEAAKKKQEEEDKKKGPPK